MKSFLIGFAIGFVIYFAIVWLPWFVIAGINEWKWKRAKKKAGEDDEWIYEI